jgi:hypothetical protein
MKKLSAIFCILSFVGCAATQTKNDFVGTWQLEGQGHYLRIYPDGRAVCWPIPPDGETTWTTIKDGVIDYNYQSPLQNPILTRRGSQLVMKTNVGEQLFDRIPNDLEPK